MTTQSAFEKRLRPESTFDRIEGMLEQMNIPPKAIEWIRRNRKTTTIMIVAAILGVITFSIYTSYIEKKIERAASALSAAAEINPGKDNQERIVALQKVAQKYSSTTSGSWAEIAIAQNLMQAEKYKESAERYSEILQTTDESNPLYALLLYGQANALEAAKAYDKAANAYKKLQNISGYKTLGYSGEGRIFEEQGQPQKAIAVYNNFILLTANEPRLIQNKQSFEARISRLQTINNASTDKKE